MKTTKPIKLDPLYVIFEQHLINFQDLGEERKTFIDNVVKDYLKMLQNKDLLIPQWIESSLVEELADQVNTMLVKKIYGCFNLSEYRKGIPKSAKRKTRTQYSRLSKTIKDET